MSLIQCKDCGREVSSKAAACPQCGGPMPRGMFSQSGVAVMLIVIAVGLVAIAAVYNHYYTEAFWDGLRGVWTPGKPKQYGGE